MSEAQPEDHPLARLRRRPHSVQLLGGFGPLAVGFALFVLMLVLLPTVAPERMVERPVAETSDQQP